EPKIPVSVTATATASGAPNINFYLLLDSSPSMGIAATTDGINTMIANTQGQCDSPPAGGPTCGCAFACHETNPSDEKYYLPTGTMNTAVTPHQLCSATPSGPTPAWPPWQPIASKTAYYYCEMSGTGNPATAQYPTGEDNFALSQSLGVTLRIDNLREGVQSLMTTAQSAETTNNAQYQMGIYTFDNSVTKIQTLTSSLTLAAASAANIQQLQVYSNNWLTSSNNNGDTDTDYTDAMTYINNQMPDPGNGTNAKNDTPQEVLFFVTDGVEDESVGGSRVQSLMNTSYCTTIKNRGIRIAVLYTEYLPIPANGWYNSHISPFQSQISANMQSCASPGLFFEVTQGGDISAALQALFNAAIQTAHLTL
ncbi:MAG: hypothetical protein ACREFB_15970, partial [Stellaceae bacterium]